MKILHSTDTVIAELVEAMYGNNLMTREKFLYAESLRNLVRLAKAEQLLEMKTSVRKLVGPLAFAQPRQRTKTSQRIDSNIEHRQCQFEFTQFD